MDNIIPDAAVTSKLIS